MGPAMALAAPANVSRQGERRLQSSPARWARAPNSSGAAPQAPAIAPAAIEAIAPHKTAPARPWGRQTPPHSSGTWSSACNASLQVADSGVEQGGSMSPSPRPKPNQTNPACNLRAARHCRPHPWESRGAMAVKMHTPLHKLKHTHARMQAHTHMYACAYLRASACVHTCTHICTHSHTGTGLHVTPGAARAGASSVPNCFQAGQGGEGLLPQGRKSGGLRDRPRVM